MNAPFKGRLAVVTGASSGIGYAFATQLAQRGMRLVLVSRNVERLERVKQELEPWTDYIQVIGADLSTVEGCDELICQLERLPHPVSILINNAGIGASGYTVDQPWSRLDEMCQLNYSQPSPSKPLGGWLYEKTPYGLYSECVRCPSL